MKRLAAVVLGGLVGCTALTEVHESVVSACQFYVTVAAITAWVPGAAAITSTVDPICRLVLAGQPVPAGVDAAFIRAKAVELEGLAEAHSRH